MDWFGAQDFEVALKKRPPFGQRAIPGRTGTAIVHFDEEKPAKKSPGQQGAGGGGGVGLALVRMDGTEAGVFPDHGDGAEIPRGIGGQEIAEMRFDIGVVAVVTAGGLDGGRGDVEADNPALGMGGGQCMEVPARPATGGEDTTFGKSLGNQIARHGVRLSFVPWRVLVLVT